jgi:ankyrin repeat protein
MVASRAGSSAVVEMLIAKGQMNAHGSRGQTALMWAVAEKHPEVVKVLIAHGANLHAKSDVWSQVMAVEPHGYLPYNKEIPAGGETALMFAARVGDLASAKLLVGAGANVNDTDAWGVSATTLAAHSDFRDVAEFLLDKGADPNAAAAGFNALHNAIMQRDEKLVASLLERRRSRAMRTWTPNRRSANDFSFGRNSWVQHRSGSPHVLPNRES